MGRKVTEFIIPAIAHLRQLYAITLKMILPVESLNQAPTSDVIDIRDISVTDSILDSIFYK